MPISWQVSDYGNTLRVRKHDTEAGTIAVLYRNLPPEAKAALKYLADWATTLYHEKAELLDAYDAEVHAHNETRHALVAKANAVLQKGIDLLALNQELQEQIAELRESQGHFPLIVEESTG